MQYKSEACGQEVELTTRMISLVLKAQVRTLNRGPKEYDEFRSHFVKANGEDFSACSNLWDELKAKTADELKALDPEATADITVQRTDRPRPMYERPGRHSTYASRSFAR